jgi:hypothetical protein
MKKIVRLTESDLTRIVKKVIKETEEVDENIWHSMFGKPGIKDASASSLRGKGYAYTGKNEEDETQWISFRGQKFKEEDIEYADPYDTGEIPRIENGKLIISNPAWRL